ncbi:LysR substrate-binding domain-containing protein [Frigidibacter sp. MR17.14]|uniref:LysR substrate-binding domain-containing protein n=1 Tax=Frigidibacter sp. MR17.14 TaxID=3126509 RepID=UPI003012FCF1
MPGPLPPLNALRAFEAAARAGGFVGAARELGVSAAAISQQVRNLEVHLGLTLFRRRNNGVELTDAGREVFAGAAEAFRALSELGSRGLGGRMRNRLVISALPSVAERWLAPRLAAFARARPGFAFTLRVEEDPVDFAGAGIDLRLCYGAALYPDLPGRVLATDAVVPMCSPDWAAAHPAALADLAAAGDADLIHTDWGPVFGSNPGWERWFATGARPRPRPGSGTVVGTSALALDMASAGLGVALGQRMLAGADLAAGRLLALAPEGMAMGHPYRLVTAPGRTPRPLLSALIDWLVAGLSPEG